MATILLFIYVETESTRCKTGTLYLLLTVGSFYINNCLLFLMYQLVLWTIMKWFRGSMVSQVLQLHSDKKSIFIGSAKELEDPGFLWQATWITPLCQRRIQDFRQGKGGRTIFCQNLRKLAHETQKKLAPIIPSMVIILGASCISKMSTTEIIYRHRGSQLLLLH